MGLKARIVRRRAGAPEGGYPGETDGWDGVVERDVVVETDGVGRRLSRLHGRVGWICGSGLCCRNGRGGTVQRQRQEVSRVRRKGGMG